MRGLSIPKPTLERAARIYKTQTQIANALGVSTPTISKLMRRYNLTLSHKKN